MKKPRGLAFVTATAASLMLGVSAVIPTFAANPDQNESRPNNEITQPAIANTTAGQIYGYRDRGVYTFKGIPYAQAARFEEPQDPTHWSGVKSTLSYGAVCPNGATKVSQFEFMSPSANDLVPSEDCLFANVWTQSLEPTAKKPIVLFIHGGGYTSGASNELPYYEGKGISSKGDAVFVSVNHRLNVLRFMDLSAYGAQYKHSGNLGMLDLIKALQWVKANAENFGGDPNNVTIMGQSGGGGKVLSLFGSPMA
ncbi:carboxylesterase family protein [Paenarthrobacter sp. NPDC089316]|uniref:carboxylesterase family protein n=1 Tax=unclassified Paenarthrobacter TaxID=2634190 RepID=UPI0034318432